MLHRSGRRLTPMALVLGSLVAACAGSTGAATPTPPVAAVTSPAPGATSASSLAPIPSIGATTAAAACPSAATVGAALGITVLGPVSITGGAGTPLPAGATAVSCEYPGTSMNVIIVLMANAPASTISQFSDKFPVAFSPVSGVGDQARSFVQALGGGKTNEGVVATKGSTLVDVVATGTPATLTQIEALVSQLL